MHIWIILLIIVGIFLVLLYQINKRKIVPRIHKKLKTIALFYCVAIVILAVVKFIDRYEDLYKWIVNPN